MCLANTYFNVLGRFQVNRDTIIISNYVEITIGSMIVPIKVRNNEKCLSLAQVMSSGWLIFFFFLIIQSYSYSAFVKEEVHC